MRLIQKHACNLQGLAPFLNRVFFKEGSRSILEQVFFKEEFTLHSRRGLLCRPIKIMEPLENQGVTETENQPIINHVDIISQLPEDVLTHILSFLPTIDAVRTFILVKAWADKYWRNNFEVKISDSQLFAESCNRLDRVVEFVSRILLLSPTNTKFHLVLSNQYNPDQIKTWISQIISRNVLSIYIVHHGESVELPSCLFHCKSLNKLKLAMACSLLAPTSSRFHSLNILHLSNARISSELNPHSCQLLLHFPVLNKLKLEDCMWLNVGSVEIQAPALIKFQVWQWLRPPPDTVYCPIKISVAELQLFEFRGYFLWNVDLHASSVSCVDILFRCNRSSLEDLYRNASLTQKILKRCWFMKCLKLEGELVKVIFQSGQGHLLHELTMLKQLEFYSSCDSKSLLEFLFLTPSMEHICLNVCGCGLFDYHSLDSMPPCVVSQLVEVEFIGFKGTAAHVNLASFFLENGVVLRKMLGLARRECEERQEEQNFWDGLKRKLTNGDFDVGDVFNE